MAGQALGLVYSASQPMTEELAFTDRDSLPDWAKRYPPTGPSCCRWQQNRVLSPHHEARGVRTTPESMAAPKNLLEKWHWHYNELRLHSARNIETTGFGLHIQQQGMLYGSV